ncbi:hypothetical protein [Paenibacillus bovis]|uniref:hypothetical protein n=1 Tax=Paenibacillus bovis TaxID=1616788 RepID=UPI00076201CD|nr:hypothetical protein [Paenibacillus bovis]
MSTPIDPEILALYREALDLPDSRTKVELLEQAVRMADHQGHVEAGYMVRSELVEAAIFSGYPRKAMIHYSWMLGQYDQNPQAYNQRNLLWSYKWILVNAIDFPEISMQQLQELIEDMRVRYQAAGYSDRTYYSNLYTLYLYAGELEQAQTAMEQVQRMPRDEMSDCSACEQDELVDHYIILGRYEEALQAAEPILQGRMSCTTVPHQTIASLLLPLYHLGRTAEAEDYRSRNYANIAGNRDYLQSIGAHIGYLTHTDPFLGLDLFERHADWLIDHESIWEVMMFTMYAAGLLRRLSKEKDVHYQIRLPAEYGYTGDKADIGALADYVLAQALDIAAQFDKRNGNSYYTGRIHHYIRETEEYN